MQPQRPPIADQPAAKGTTPSDLRASAIFPHVYQDLRNIAASRMRTENSAHTLQATALVHEAYGKLVKRDTPWNDRQHFVFAAAQAMHDILIDHARSKSRMKRGGGRKASAIDLSVVANLESADDPDALLELDNAVEQLAKVDPAAEQIVRLRFFGGLTYTQIGEAMAIDESTVRRKWEYARAWLARKVMGEGT